jgi:predicted metal-dependent phosphotriesterase family hydrolase
MSFIRTVLGDIDPKDFGVCDSHDHMIRSGGPEVVESKDFLLDDVQASKLELERWVKAGGKSMVCMDPIGCGRNVAKTIELAQLMAHKVHLVATTGFQKGDFYDHKISFVAT